MKILNAMKWKQSKRSRILMIAALVLFFAALFAANSSENRSIYGVTYEVTEILYDAPQYSFTYTAGKTPGYTITADGMLMERQYGDQTWVSVGGLQKVNYSRNELYQLFDPLYNNVHERLDQVKSSWRVDVGNEQGSFYLLMQTRKGDVLLACGYGEELDGRVRWLFELKAGSAAYVTEELEAKVESMCGRDVECFAVCEIDSMPQCLVMGFHDDGDMGVAFLAYSEEDNEYKARSYSSFGGEDLYSMTMAENQDLDHSITVAFSRREDLALVTANVGEQHQELGVSGICPVMVVFEWPEILPEGEEGKVGVRFYNALGEELER